LDSFATKRSRGRLPLQKEKEIEMTTEAKQPTKLPYEKPKLRVIDLAAEEVLGIGCKTVGTTATGATPCAAGCHQTGS
jgi:hypothetical protein